MRIVVDVTGIAACQKFGVEDRFDVTIVTGNFPVTAEELVVRMYVVVEERLFPRCTGMASVALLAAVHVMRVVFQVTGSAGFVHFVVERIFRMAVATGCVRMCAFQREVRVTLVIETRIMPVARVVAGVAFIAATSVVCVVCFMAAEAGCWGFRKGVVVVTVQAVRFSMLSK